MTADELLRFTRYNKLRDRSVPSLWSDETLLLYLNDGMNRFCSQTDHLVESSRELPVASGVEETSLDDDIRMVYSVRLEGYENSRLQPATEGWTPDCTYTARPSRYTVERATGIIRFYPIPDADYTALLRVAHVPAPLSLDSLDVECDLPDDMLLVVSEWAAHRAFSEDDADGRNDLAAEKALARYNEGMNRFKRDNYRLRMGFGARAHGQRVK